jgi:uncharacterized protein YndB with AHSA1/START domain
MGQQMLHIVAVSATPAEIYRAVSTSDGLRSFWTADTDGGGSVGSEARFGFPGAPVDLRMKIIVLEADSHVTWQCLGDFPYWAGTTVDWSISASATAPGSLVTFRHSGWPNDYPDAEYGLVNYVWGQIVGRLKEYVETGVPCPVYPPTVAPG